MNENKIHTDSGEFLVSASQNVQVMLDTFQYAQKPTKPQTAAMSKRIEKLAICLGLYDLMYRVGVQGQAFIPATMDGLGRSAGNWVHQQVFCLDFDNKEEIKITLEEFYERCTAIGIHPAFVYLTFSHGEVVHKFRAVFVVSQVIVDIRLRNLVMLLLMELFPGRDKSCPDPSRIFYGGKGIHSENLQSRINPIQLLNAWLKETKGSDPKNFARAKVSLGNKLGKDSGPNAFSVQQTNHVTIENYGIMFCPLIFRTYYKLSSISQVTFEGLQYEIQWICEKKSSSNGNAASKAPKMPKGNTSNSNSKPNLSPSDVELLNTRCRLFREFHKGERRLPKLERRILLCNLRTFRNGLPTYREGLSHFGADSDYPDPYPFEDRDLIDCANHYDFLPEGCCNCPYSNECTHGTNLIQQIRLRQGACRIVEEPFTKVSLEVARAELAQATDDIFRQNLSVRDFSIVRAECGIGKTEVLLRLLLVLDRICISFPTHRLAQEAFERYKSLDNGGSFFLWPERPRLPQNLQSELRVNDKIGLFKTRSIFEAALQHPEVNQDTIWTSAIEDYLEAYISIHQQTRVFCTHEKALHLIDNGTSRIDTFVFDEDPMRSLFKIDQIALEDVQATIAHLKSLPEIPTDVVARLEDVQNCEPNILAIPDTISIPYGSLESYLPSEGVHTPVLSLVDCTGYIKPKWNSESTVDDVYCITHRALPEKYKYVMLSATPILPLYQKAYGDRVKVWDISSIEKKGKLFLHRDRSFSKRSILDMGKDFVTEVEGYVESHGLDGVITFKELSASQGSGYTLKGSTKSIPVLSTFGATEGINSASGKTIGVVGTPHLPEYALKLLGHAVGVDVSPNKFEFKCRTVRRHEFEVSLWCISDDEFFQALEFAVVESQLQQAVGRARLLQSECEVHMWSNYVLSGGELWDRAS